MSSLVLSLLLISVGGVDSNLLVILLEGGEILSSLGELSLLHTLSNVPVDEGPLGVEEIELLIESGPGGRDGGGVA